MNRYLSLLCLLLAFSAYPALAAEKNDFHPPANDPEKTMDDILQYNYINNDMRNFALKHKVVTVQEKSITDKPAPLKHLKGYNAWEEKRFSSLFTKALQDAWIAADKKPAGVEFNPITCDSFEGVTTTFVYHTQKISENKVLVSFSGADGEIISASPYRMIRDKDGLWKLDSVDCGDGYGYNLK